MTSAKYFSDGPGSVAEAAQAAVADAMSLAEFDDIRGVIFVQGDPRLVAFSGDGGLYGPVHRWLPAECASSKELRAHLRRVYAAVWHDRDPFARRSGADFERGADTCISRELSDRSVDQFFHELNAPPNTDLIFASRELVASSGRSRVLRLEVQELNEELIRYLGRRPELMRDMSPRRFEHLVAELFRDKGYDVEITPATNDGGIDLVAVARADIGSALTVVECKRYSAKNPVGVDVVRGLYGVVEEMKATRGVIATTSYFTRGARAFRDSVPYRIGLADFDVLTQFLRGWTGAGHA